LLCVSRRRPYHLGAHGTSGDRNREICHLAAAGDVLRRRVLAVLRRVPLPYPRFWLVALGSLSIGWAAPLPPDPGIA